MQTWRGLKRLGHLSGRGIEYIYLAEVDWVPVLSVEVEVVVVVIL